MIAGKKDEDYRFCVDYHRLNEITVNAPQCLPRLHETLKELGNARIFSTLDIKSGYWQIPMFFPMIQSLVRQILAEKWGMFALAYLDDIIIYSSD